MEWSLDSAVGDQLADVDPLADVDLVWKRKFGEQNVFIPETFCLDSPENVRPHPVLGNR